MIGVGTLASGVTATVAVDGTVHHGSRQLQWHVRSGNDWLRPGAGAPTRQSRPHPAPVVHTALRIPGGDAVERVYAVGEGERSIVVVEVENDSPQAIAVGFTVLDAGGRVEGGPVLAAAQRPGAVEPDHGHVFPVPHRTRVRVALPIGGNEADVGALDVRALADADAVCRAWDRMLDRGLRVELPEPLQSDVDAARVDLLLAPPSAATFAALEAWGFDDDAIAMWDGLSMRARRAARRVAGGGVLAETRAALIGETVRAVDLVPGFRTAWLGQSIAAHDIPLRSGRCSFAVRWHAARPALLWDVPAGSTVRAPALDPSWSSTLPVGEALLAEPPASLLSMGDRAAVTGTTVEAPEQFS